MCIKSDTGQGFGHDGIHFVPDLWLHHALGGVSQIAAADRHTRRLTGYFEGQRKSAKIDCKAQYLRLCRS
jgi:hypothetical protein